MIPLILLVLESAAITLVFTRGSIFARVRSVGPAWWRELASCAMCSGFWVGVGCYTMSMSYVFQDLSSAWEGWYWWAALRYGALSAAASLLLVRVLDALEKAGND